MKKPPFEAFTVRDHTPNTGEFRVRVNWKDKHEQMPHEEWLKLMAEQRQFIEDAIREKLEREKGASAR